MSNRNQMPLFEVFVRGRRGLDHIHVGSLHVYRSLQTLPAFLGAKAQAPHPFCAAAFMVMNLFDGLAGYTC